MTIVATWRNATPSIFQVFIVVTPNIHTYRALVQELLVQYRFCNPQKDLHSILQWTWLYQRCYCIANNSIDSSWHHSTQRVSQQTRYGSDGGQVISNTQRYEELTRSSNADSPNVPSLKWKVCTVPFWENLDNIPPSRYTTRPVQFQRER